MSKGVVKVSALVRYLKGSLENDQRIQQIAVSGEISNLTKHRSGHWYFTLKDAQARLSCVMFSSAVQRCKVDVQNGDQVILQGNVSVFESSGQLQLYVTAMRLDGVGDLYQQYEFLKKKLFEEGLFDDRHKKVIPRYPQTIGLITGKNTAAREDVLSTLERRWPLAKIVERNTLVQGNQASEQIIEALKLLDEENVDVILLVRGGGSLEDLWAFNHENLAKTIFDLKTPIIVGVGHEVDVTIVDYVADRRAPTPTGAAEMATPSKEDVESKLKSYQQQILTQTIQRVEIARKTIKQAQEFTFFRNPERMVQQKVLLVDMKQQQLLQQISKVSKQRMTTSDQLQRLAVLFNNQLQMTKQDIADKTYQLSQSVSNQKFVNRAKLFKAIDLLDAYSPLKVLKRGYALAYANEKLVTSINQVNINESIELKVHDGEIMATIIEKRLK